MDALRLAPSNVLVVGWGASDALLTAARALGCRALAPPAAAAAAAAALAGVQGVAALAAALSGAARVGYAMKASRQAALIEQGMLPLLPVDGVCFVPVDLLAVGIEAQPRIDLLLHKATDFLVSTDSGSGAVPAIDPRVVARLQALAAAGVCVVDPPPALGPALDRALGARAVEAACAAARRLAVPVRSPAWALCADLQGDGARGAGVGPPCVVKPQVACGVAQAHSMALILRADGLRGCGVPAPAVVQEYVDHGGVVWKVYVAGSKVRALRRRRHLAKNTGTCCFFPP